MRRAEFVVAGLLALFSLYLMYKSAELPIGWEPRRGPGGGAFPFWLSVGMLVSTIVIMIRAALRKTPESRSTEPYMDKERFILFVTAAGGIDADVQAFYEGVFKKVNDSAEWKEYTSKKALNRAWLTGDDLMAYFIEEREKHRVLLKAMGEID